MADDMSTKRGINRLSRALHELYYKFCDMDLHKRMSLYHRNTSTNNPDISASLTKHIDKLALSSKPSSATTTNTTANAGTTRPSNRVSRHGNIKQLSQQHGWLNKVVSSVIRPKKIFTSKIASNPYMGDKLKDSTWSHIHTALLQARQGNAYNAKLHADIANGALKEAAHYMSEENYKALCGEVAKAFKELEG
ncbi:MAG: hypothetical protein ACNYZG_10050 [Gammaproteobacteria bacterium]